MKRNKFLESVKSDAKKLATFEKEQIFKLRQINSVLRWINSVIEHVGCPDRYILLSLQQIHREQQFIIRHRLDSIMYKSMKMQQAIDILSNSELLYYHFDFFKDYDYKEYYTDCERKSI